MGRRLPITEASEPADLTVLHRSAAWDASNPRGGSVRGGSGQGGGAKRGAEGTREREPTPTRAKTETLTARPPLGRTGKLRQTDVAAGHLSS